MKRVVYTVETFKKDIRIIENTGNRVVTEAHFFNSPLEIDNFIKRLSLQGCSEILPGNILFVYLNTYKSLHKSKHKYAGRWLPMTPTHHFQTSKDHFVKHILPDLQKQK
jgi:hypothetical protein